MNDCPLDYALNLLNGKWKLKIIYQIECAGTIRFNELQRKVDGVSNVILSKSLQELQKDKIIHRKQYDTIPPKVEYSLSDLGKEIAPALNQLSLWGEKAYSENQK